MSGFLKRNINGILGTILVHMLIVIVAMAFKLAQPQVNDEDFLIIDPQFMEEMLEEQKPDEATQKELDDIEIEKYINEIRNIGSNNRIKTDYSELEAMTEEELKQKYESELLKEKYGDDYEKMKNSTYEDYMKEQPKNNSQNNKQNNSSSSAGNYAGPALVYVELQNPDRGKSYIHVPVFTCKDGGRIVISITIASDGSVKSATVTSAKSTGDATCISNAAKDAALKSKFTPVAGGKTETGTITYSFMQQ
jgi:hypothetical protein